MHESDLERLKRLKYMLDVWKEKAVKANTGLAVRESGKFFILFADIDEDMINARPKTCVEITYDCAKQISELLEELVKRETEQNVSPQ